MGSVGTIRSSKCLQTGGDGTFELCFRLWRENELTGRKIRGTGDRESEEDHLMKRRQSNRRIAIYYLYVRLFKLDFRAPV